ncbi:hypothetical protein LY78DRAFT_618367, partial [Colletotrichum sublineola]
ANSPSQYHPLASNVPQDPRQALDDVNDTLQTIRTSRVPLPLAPQLHTTPSSTATPSHYSYTQSLSDAFHLSPHPFNAGPSSCDGVSTRSGHTSNSSRTETCFVCGAAVNSKQIQRHYQDRHRQEGDPQYICKCGHADPALRKSNHIRHLEKCKSKDDWWLVFTCRCGNTLSDSPAHLDHIKDCGKKRAGRPPNSARNVNYQ